MEPTPIDAFINDFLNGLRQLNAQEYSLDRIRQRVKVVEVSSGQTLIVPGRVCSEVFLVLQGGFVCRHVHAETGEAKTINFFLNDLHPFMACLDSYFTQTPTQCELRAIAPSCVLSMQKMEIDALILEDAALEKFYQSVVTTALIEENELKTKLISYSSKDMFQCLIQDFPVVIQKVPSKYIAEFMGITAEWLSKLKRNHG